MKIRHAAVAGTFYPGTSSELGPLVSSMLAQAPSSSIQPKALIAPHAGYIYSGETAATAYRSLMNKADSISRVIILGPSHRVGFSGIAAPDCDAFETPLGSIEIDQSTIESVLDLPFVQRRADAHLREHSIEVQLPFLQTILKDFKFAPFVVGDANAEEVSELLERVWGDEETLIIVSSDLSHYHPYKCAQLLDATTTREIEQRHTNLSGDQACGCRPINGLLRSATKHNLNVQTLDLRNSGDTAGSKDGVVGYGAYALV